MKIKFGRVVHYFYFCNFLLLTAVMIYGIKFFWQQGSVNLENTGSVFEATIKVNELKNRNDVADLKDLVESDKTVEAEKLLESFEKKVKQLDESGHLKKEYSALQESIKETKENLHGLATFQERGAILISLESKVKQFENFVIDNKWRTLTRMIGRIKAQIDPAQARKAGFFNYQKISELTKSLSRDLSVMVSVTEGSVLSQQNKDLVLVKINTFKSDIVALEKYLEVLKDFTESQEKLQENYKTWFKAMGPQIAMKKMEMENSSRSVLMAMILLVVCLSASMIAGFLLYRYSQKKNQERLERFCLDLIKDGLLPQENRISDFFSPPLASEFERLRQTVHNRMSFGAVFQEATPFPAMLLDSNLNLAWGNTLFYDEWKMTKGDSLSWDFIRRLTNLVDNDPVHLALNEGVAGIYHVEVKPHAEAEAAIYEMFVSPVDIQGARKIMIFCYPLKAVHESLKKQRENIKAPLLRTLEAMRAGLYSEELKGKLKTEFNELSLLDVHEKFIALDEKQRQEIKGLEVEIQNLDNFVSKLQDNLKLALNLHDERSIRMGQVIKKFENAKDGIVSGIDDRNAIEEIRLNTTLAAKNLCKSERLLIDEAKRLETTVDESLKTFRNTSNLRTEFSGLKGSINDFRTRIMELLDQLMVWDRAKTIDPHRVSEALSRVRMEMKGFEKNLSSLGTLTVNLDVTLGKIQFILESYKKPNLDAHKDLVDEAEAILDSDALAGDRIHRVAQENDQVLISSFGEIFKVLKEDVRDSRHLQKEAHKTMNNVQGTQLQA